MPLIIQFLFYNGEQAPYPYPTTLQAHYSQPEWAAQELSLRFHLIDVTQISDAAFLTHGHCAPMALLLKHGREGNFELPPDAYQDVFQACTAALGDEYILTYAAELGNPLAGEKIFHFLEGVLIDKKDLITTYGQQIEQRGEQRSKLQIAKNMLSNLHLDIQMVQRATGLSQEELMKLQEEARQ